MPNLLKFYNRSKKIEKYSFSDHLEEASKAEKIKEKEAAEKETAEEGAAIDNNPEEPAEEPGEVDKPVEEAEEPDQSLAKIHAEEIVSQAREEAERMLEQARADAEKMRADAEASGYNEGFGRGYEDGRAKGEAEMNETMEFQCRAYLEEIRTAVEDVSRLKEEILQKYKHDLKNIAIAIGEKVIQISLKSSGSVIEKMIVSATEKLKTREWAKIYISRVDADLMVEGDQDILKALSRLSANLKVVAMENEKPGTCIIELPDQIIDASASTQVENIKEIINSTGI